MAKLRKISVWYFHSSLGFGRIKAFFILPVITTRGDFTDDNNQ
jgi:hypothetical protein